MRKDTVKNIIKIVNCLKEAENGWLWIREISRRTGLHHKTVSRLIELHLTMFVEEQAMEPFNVKMVKLKEGTDINNIYRFLSVMEKVKER
jgi:DNA-binding IclR family transcriptional regulator